MSLRYTAVSACDNGSPSGLSETNLVVGKVWNPNSRMQSTTERAYVYSDGVFSLLELGNVFNSQAMGVGEGNVIVGTATPPSRRGVNGWVYDNGNISWIQGFGGTVVMPRATNGKIHVGQANLPRMTTRAFKHENGITTDLGTLGGPAAIAEAVNASGTICGQSRIKNETFQMVAFIYKDSKMTALPGLSEKGSSWAYGINDNDEVVGLSEGPNGRQVVKWVNEKVNVITPGHGYAGDINNSGHMVGSTGNPGNAFVHDGQKLYDLNEITSGLDGWQLNTANRINNAGCIVATGLKNNRFKTFILIPE